MNSVYILQPTDYFLKKFKKLTKKQAKLQKRVSEQLEKLRQDPKDPSLGSHKVTTAKFGQIWSIRITGDIRVLWNYDENDQIVLLLLDIGGHDEVY